MIVFLMKTDRLLSCSIRSQLQIFTVLVGMSWLGNSNEAKAQPEIQVLPGFEVKVAAASPLVEYPMMACLDDRGRLYIAESDGRNLTTRAAIERELPRFVRRLVDEDGDGTYDSSTIFADKMTMPEGGLWYGGALYIISPPYLWRLEDVDDDGVADKREKILGSMEFDGRANQHGPYLGPNGRFYFSGGHFGYDLIGTDGSRSGVSRAAGVFSCWPDGSDVRIEGQGGINPVDIIFTPNGDMLSTCAIFDSFGGRRHDALIHWMRGGLTQRVYGTPLLAETGFRLPAVSRWGQVAPAGLVRYRGTSFGSAYRDTLFACQFNTHKVVHIALKPEDGSFVTEEQDFLSSSTLGFHPADILEDVDGSLLLLDTGGWLSWGCPFSQSAKPEIKGGVYRIQKKDAQIPANPRGAELDWASLDAAALIALLKDRRPAARDMAAHRIVAEGNAALRALEKALKQEKEPIIRKRLLWVVSRMEGKRPLRMLRNALEDQNAGVRQVASRSLGERKDGHAVKPLIELLGDDDPFVRGSTATALGLIGSEHALDPLFQHLDASDPIQIQHAFVFAMTEIGDAKGVVKYLHDASQPYQQKIALRVLDALGKELNPGNVMPLLLSPDQGVRQEARRVASNRREFKPAMIKVFGELMHDRVQGESNTQLIESLILSYAHEDDFQNLLKNLMTSEVIQANKKVQMMRTIGFLDEFPASLNAFVMSGLKSDHHEIRSATLNVARQFEMPSDILNELSFMASTDKTSTSDRVQAISVIANQKGQIPHHCFEFLIHSIINERTSVIQARQIAQALGKLRLDLLEKEQRVSYIQVISKAPPFCVSSLLQPFDLGELAAKPTGLDADAWDALGLQLAVTLKGHSSLGMLRQGDQVLLKNAFPNKQSRAHQALIHVMESELSLVEAQASTIQSMLDDLPAGNASRGRVLFHSEKTSCGTCHKIDGQGGQLGPNLSRIGQIRQAEDLMEAILFPSATVVNGYENYSFELSDGEIVDGVIQHESREAIYLVNAAMQEVRVDRNLIEKVHHSDVSLMPSGFDQTLSRQALLDLVAYLLTCR